MKWNFRHIMPMWSITVFHRNWRLVQLLLIVITDGGLLLTHLRECVCPTITMEWHFVFVQAWFITGHHNQKKEEGAGSSWEGMWSSQGRERVLGRECGVGGRVTSTIRGRLLVCKRKGSLLYAEHLISSWKPATSFHNRQMCLCDPSTTKSPGAELPWHSLSQ